LVQIVASTLTRRIAANIANLPNLLRHSSRLRVLSECAKAHIAAIADRRLPLYLAGLKFNIGSAAAANTDRARSRRQFRVIEGGKTRWRVR